MPLNRHFIYFRYETVTYIRANDMCYKAPKDPGRKWWCCCLALEADSVRLYSWIIQFFTFTAKVTIVLDFVNNHPMTSCSLLFGVYVRVCMFTVLKKGQVSHLLQLTNLANLPLWNLGSSPSPILSKVLHFRNSFLLSLYLLQFSISKLFWISSQKLAASTIIFLFTFRIWIYFTFFQTWVKTDVEVFISATVCY